MNSNQKLYCAIAAILGSGAVGMAHAATAATDTSATAATETTGLQEIVVTAQRRSENLQDVPIAIQALTGETLNQLNVTTIEDFLKYLPNVTSPTNGPGQGNIFMRGLSVGGYAGTQSSGTIGGFPNVAIYLDDQSGQLPGRNLDIYAADLERIEILEGPQGTLFGAGAQAGVVRYITNKPKLDVTEGSVTAGYGITAGGDPNTNATAVLNVPLIPDTLAVRAVIYDDTRGGYINNVPSTFTRQASDLGIYYANYATACSAGAPVNGACGTGAKPTAYGVPPGSPVINNYNIARNAINPVTYQGLRASALYKINDDWNFLLAQTFQNMDAEGVFYQMPYSSEGVALAPQQVTLFNNSYDKDKFENTAWTLNGKVGALKLVYTGAYLVRNVDQVQDYTNYARGVYADYYQCHGANAAQGLSSTCYSPASTWREQERNTHQSHELRLSTPDDWRFRAIGGAFWEDQRIYDQTDWAYKTLPACTASDNVGCLTDVGPVPGSTTVNPSIRNDSTAFFEDVQRGYKQYAAFTSLDFDIIPKVLTITAGTRYYHFTNFETGTVVSSFGCYEGGAAPCTGNAPYSHNLDALNLHSTYSGFKSRANLTWHVTSDALLYYTWSQGFRPGAFNRTSSCHVPDASGVNQYCTPQQYTSDSLTNNELGWKTEFFGHRLQWDGAVYQENWNNVQFGFFDPGQLGNLAFGTNGPNYRIRGLETSITAQLMQGLTFTGAGSWNSSEQTNSPYLVANNPALLANPATAGEYGKPLTAFQNPFGPIGSPSANSPPIQLSARLRYEWMYNDYHWFVQGGGTHQGHSFTQAGSNPTLSQGGAINTTLLRFENPAFSTFDASFGIAKDAWNVQFFGQNLTDSHAPVFTSTGQFVEAQTIIRPRVLGMSVGYKF